MKHAHLVLPSGPVGDEALHAGLAVLEELGIPWTLPPLNKLAGGWRPYLAGTDDERAAALADAMATGEQLLMIRGGYGAIRTLAALESRGFPQQAGALWGFSDGTALLSAWSARGWPCWSAPPLIQLPRLDQASRDSFATAWRGEPLSPVELVTLNAGEAKGSLAGGNLCLLASLVGTPWAADLTDALVLVEDIGEQAYKVDRMFEQLVASGALAPIAGLIVGEFTGVDEGHRGTIAEVISDVARRLNVPCAKGLPLGHGTRNWSFPWGVATRATPEGGLARLVATAEGPARLELA